MPPPTKRRKVDTDDTAQKSDRIEELEQETKRAINERASLNCLADLLKEAKSLKGRPELLHKAIYSLYRSFSLLIAEDWFHSSTKPSEKEALIRKWLVERLDQYYGLLSDLFEHEEPSISQAATQIPLSLLKQLSSSLSQSSGYPQIHSRTFRHIVPLYLSFPTSTTVLQELVNQYDDIRWFTLREISVLLRRADVGESLVENALQLLEGLKNMPKSEAAIKSFFIPDLAKNSKFTPPESIEAGDTPTDDEDDWRKYFDSKDEDGSVVKTESMGRAGQLSTYQALHSLPSHRAQFSFAWLGVLQHVKKSSQQSSRVLSILHRSIMPHLVQPIQLMDWIGACVEFDGSIALLAFNALFVLIQEHNLDYPDFYTRLYALLDQNILHVKYRARFFRLLELFLSSTHLPASILASFSKRLARLSLSAPPPAIIMVIPFIYNVLKRHPSLMGMIHREVDDDALSSDPFLAEEPSPLLTNALESSLWEINSQKSHYAPPVATMAKIFSEVFTKPSYVLEDFLDHTYGTMFTAESKRRIVNEPAISLNPDIMLFGSTEKRGWADTKDPCSMWTWT